jgi:hypothetical protein
VVDWQQIFGLRKFQIQSVKVEMPKNEVDNNLILDLIIFNNRKNNENREQFP